jgi:hypothetical protein
MLSNAVAITVVIHALVSAWSALSFIPGIRTLDIVGGGKAPAGIIVAISVDFLCEGAHRAAGICTAKSFFGSVKIGARQPRRDHRDHRPGIGRELEQANRRFAQVQTLR